MLPSGEPKFRRRKAERPEQIVSAAMEVFARKGFAAARLDDIAAKAGVSKGAIYLYFPTKEDVFRAVVEQGVAPNLDHVRAMIAASDLPFPQLARGMIGVIANLAATSPLGGIVKMVIGEARNFPELARVWHERLVTPALATLGGAIAQAQARGELRPGDPRHYAFGLVAPLLMGVIWRETFTPIGAEPIDIPALAQQHLELWLRGLAPDEAKP